MHVFHAVHQTRLLPSLGENPRERTFRRLISRQFVPLAVVLSMVFAVAAPAQSAVDAGFVLEPGDTLQLNLLDQDKPPISLPIGPNGTIQAPFIGSVSVEGMTLAEVLAELNRRYLEANVFVKPNLGLSVESYRPVFVIGDVQKPGSFPYQPMLTAQKAMALAGGPQVAPTDDPVLARARLRGDLERTRADVVQEAWTVARLTAQIDGRKSISDEDIPEAARAYVSLQADAAARQITDRILAATIRSFNSRSQSLSTSIAEAEEELSLLKQLAEKVSSSVDVTRQQLARFQSLQEKGIGTASQVSNLQREVADQEGRLIQVSANMSETRRSAEELRSQLADLQENYDKQALVDLQTHNTGLARALALARSAEDQLTLLAESPQDAMTDLRNAEYTYTIQRGADDGAQQIVASATTVLAPGDVLDVRIRRANE